MNEFVFYDLETSGLNPAEDRIMQFAAIKTDSEFNKLAEWNFLIRLNNDVLPSPGAIKVTGITPQKTIEEGYTEAEAAKIIHDEIFTANSVIVGFNNIRFDDNFIRFLFWRNYYDAYEWSWKDGRSRWDLLDIVRMVRAVSPEGINWPVDESGKPTNRLELLSSLNGLEHEHAHDALSDVEALIGVTKLIRDKKPELWQKLFDFRDKKLVNQLVNLKTPQPFVYTSGRLEWEFEKTSIFYPIAQGKNGSVIVWNLRYDPFKFKDKTPLEIIDFINSEKQANQENQTEVKKCNPVYFKELKPNQCPAVLPVTELGDDDWQRIKLDKNNVRQNIASLRKFPEISANIANLYKLKDKKVQDLVADKVKSPESSLYDGFLADQDKLAAENITKLSKEELKSLTPQFVDERLSGLFLGYKARSFPKLLTQDEIMQWEQIRAEKINSKINEYLLELDKIQNYDDKNSNYLATELKLWLESIMPSDLNIE